MQCRYFLLFTASVRSRPPGPPAVPGVLKKYNMDFSWFGHLSKLIRPKSTPESRLSTAQIVTEFEAWISGLSLETNFICPKQTHRVTYMEVAPPPKNLQTIFCDLSTDLTFWYRSFGPGVILTIVITDFLSLYRSLLITHFGILWKLKFCFLA